MSRNVGLLILGLSLIVATLCGGLIFLRLHPTTESQIAQPAFDVKPAPPVRVRLNDRPLSVNIDLPGDPILIPQRATGAPRDLVLGVPARPGAPVPPAAPALFVSSPLALTEAGAMLKYTGGGQDAQALREQLANNMAALNGAISEESMATDDDGGVATPDHPEFAALTNANSNRIELQPADAPSVKSAVLKAIVQSRIGELLVRDGFTEASAADVSARIQATYRVDSLAAGGSMLAVGTRDPAGGYRVTQVSIFQGREYAGAVGLAESGTYAEAARPNLPENFLDENEAAGPPTRFSLADGLFSAGLASGAPEAVVREAIQLLGGHVDPNTPLTGDSSFRLLYAREFRDRARGAGKVIFIEVRGGSLQYACYAIEGPDGGFRCFDPRASLAPEAPAPLPPSRPGAEVPLPPLPHGRLAESGASSIGGILAPIKGAPVTSSFGMRFHPILHYWRLHAGIDFGAPVGSPVRAPADGTVEIAGPVSGYGTHVRMQHKGFGTSVSHLSEIIDGVKVGSEVKQGQIIAYSGNTGLSTGPHLHFEFYIGGEAVDPLPHLGTEVQLTASVESEAPRRPAPSAQAPTPEPRAAPSAEVVAFPAYKALVDKALAMLL